MCLESGPDDECYYLSKILIRLSHFTVETSIRVFKETLCLSWFTYSLKCICPNPLPDSTTNFYCLVVVTLYEFLHLILQTVL